ncbi:hypothetical protein B0I35DRAFT_442174 [Stachybotrys elegans]|uniref:Nucleoside phosphorylase domain-containing protein n=1 Tax=Stachybotrys elegans TaxID=80388 RepID=A0A8K0SHV7_9HYPO|nr:hypothetical protein B0I35DRAFT_442174 [Stachybotrys elegans]
MTKRLSHDKYKVAWICPLEVEQIAAMEMLDEEHEALPQSTADHNVYSLGSINGHNVVIAGLYQPGNCPAATVVAQMRMTFPNLRFGLLVGIGGGVPVQTDSGMIRLGHVVVSKPAGEHSGAVQYDHGKAKDGQFQRTGALAPPPAVLLNAAQALAVRRARMADDPVKLNVGRINTSLRNLRRYQFPGVDNDHLYPPHYSHLRSGTACGEGGCDPSQRIHRADDDDDTYVVVHRGTIASGELVVKTARLRDTLAQQYGLLCFEMEAAGALSEFPCMVIRGISDYCDSHKNDQWHGYAAAVAAAYARQLFFHMPIDEVQREHVAVINSTATSFTLVFKLLGVTGVNHFVARSNELTHMYEVLKWNGERRTVVLHGLGGMGKTQLAIAYAKRHRKDYSAVIWLNAKDEASLRQSFAQAAERILNEYPDLAYIRNAKANRDLDEMMEAVKRWLDEPENSRWLVIYDNYDDVRLDGRGSADSSVQFLSNTAQTEAADAKAYDIRRYFPEAEHGAIVITTRSSRVKLGEVIRLSKLGDTRDSLAILASTSNLAHLFEDPHAYTLVQRLDGLPLALSTAGAYFNQLSTTCAEYLQLYEESWLRLHEESPQLLEYDRALYSTWEVSFRHIQQQSHGASMLLRLWAYFDNEDLWYELLQEGGSERPVWLQEMTEDKLTFNTAMRILCEHGLAEADPPTREIRGESRGYSVHACVHSWMMHVLNTGIDAEMSWTAMKCVARHVPRKEEREYWVIQRRLLQHADRCITRRAIDVVKEEGASIFHDLGNLYFQQGRLDKAEAICKRALECYEQAYGLEHISTLTMLHNLGLLFAKQGRLKEAEAMYEQALQGKEKASGPEHASTLETVSNLGALYGRQGRFKEAEAMYKRALQGFEKALGPEHTQTLDTLNNLGIVYQEQGQFKQAKSIYNQVLQGREKALGSDHTSTLNIVNNIGLLFAEQGRLGEAEAMFERALQVYEKAWGPDHTSTLNIVNNIGLLYAKQGRLDEAEAMFERALQGFEKALGPNAVRTYPPALDTLYSLGSLYEKLGDNGKAIPYYQRAQDGVLSVLGSQNERYTYLCDKIASLQLCAQEMDVSLSGEAGTRAES